MLQRKFKSLSSVDDFIIWSGRHLRSAIEYCFRVIEYLIASIAMTTAAAATSNVAVDVLSIVTSQLFAAYVGWGFHTALFSYLFTKRIEEGRYDVLRRGDFAWYSRWAAIGLAYIGPQLIAYWSLPILGRDIAKSFGLD
jgi:hypothetical protein